MAVITPQSDVYLLKVPLEMDEANQLTFANATAQYNYFNGLPNKLSVTDFTYVRKDSVIRYGDNIDDLLEYNYVMYRNDGYSNKWFYAFITGLEYINDNVTAIKIKTDVWQTWQFDLTYKRTFVEREHANVDTAGSNLLPEDVEHGEYKMNGAVTKFGNYLATPVYVINADKAPSTDSSGQPVDGPTYMATNVGGTPMSGGLFFFYDMVTLTNAVLTYSRMTGGLDHIKNVYVTTTLCFNGNDLEDGTYSLDEFAYYRYTGTSTPETTTVTLTAPTTIDGYTPRNKKLLSAPYQYLLISNNNGSTNKLDYEYFTNRSSISFTAIGTPVVGGSILAYPNNYKGTTDNINEGVIGGKFPTLSWSGDAFTNWLTQNSVNIGANIATNALGIGASAATGLLSGGVASVIGINAAVSSLKAITGQLTAIYDHSIIPNTFSGNINGGDVITSGKLNELYIWKMSITSQFAAVIDSYFDMFGYKTNQVKIPNITGRRNWNYVKTIGCYIEAHIPQDDLQEIKNMFDKGITFWHNASTFADYSQTNDII